MTATAAKFMAALVASAIAGAGPAIAGARQVVTDISTVGMFDFAAG